MSNHELPENEDDSQVKLADSAEATSHENSGTSPGALLEGSSGAFSEEASGSVDLGYAVGYRRPPAHTRFRPGRSGNPRGRPRGSKNMKTVLQAELDRRITITENGKPKKVSVIEALVKKLVAHALGDSDRAREKLFDMALRHGPDQADDALATGTSDDEKFLELLKSLSRGHKENQQ